MRRLASTLAVSIIASLLLVSVVHRSSPVRAGTTVRMEVSDLVQSSQLVVEARVLSSRPLENAGRIETEYLLEVERTFEGEDRALRLVRLPGGVLEDGRGMMLAGMPRLSDGESTLLFLSGEGETGIRVPVGLAQGKYRVVRRAADGAKVLVQDGSGVELVSKAGVHLGAMRGRAVPYVEMVAEIEAAVAAKRAREAREARERRRDGGGR